MVCFTDQHYQILYAASLLRIANARDIESDGAFCTVIIAEKKNRLCLCNVDLQHTVHLVNSRNLLVVCIINPYSAGSDGTVELLCHQYRAIQAILSLHSDWAPYCWLYNSKVLS